MSLDSDDYGFVGDSEFDEPLAEDRPCSRFGHAMVPVGKHIEQCFRVS